MKVYEGCDSAADDKEEDRKGTTMKNVIKTYLGALIAMTMMIAVADAQTFLEREQAWKTQTLRASGIDTTRITMHSFFSIEALNDTLPLIYHEPYPDSVMPRSAIEVAQITIQADNSDEVIEILEKQARKLGADWIVGFNEPRMKWQKIGSELKATYRSQATLYKVIDAELAPINTIADIYCGENHLTNCQAVLTWIDSEHK